MRIWESSPRTWERLRPPHEPDYARGLMLIGRTVLEARVDAGLSQRELGAICGLHQSTISRLERGKLPGLSMKNLAIVLGVLADPRRSRWMANR